VNKKYKNPPIVEAVCELRFELEAVPDQSVIEAIFEALKSKFPEKKKPTQQQIQFELNIKEKKEEFKHSSHPFDQFFSADGKDLVQINKGVISIHRLRPYQSWEVFSETIRLVLETYRKSVRIKSLQRIGLRYINRIEIPAATFNEEDYFHWRPTTPDGIPKDVSSFIVGAVFPFEGGRDSVKAQLVSELPVPIVDKSPFILDVDYSLGSPGTIEEKDIEEWLVNAHNHIIAIFESVSTEKAKLLFNQ
jgi:uncharacterized protein (TIGR04255 family)